MQRVIVKYTLADAWGTVIARVEIADAAANNVRCVYPCRSHYLENDTPTKKVYTLNEQQLHRIESILHSNIDIFEIEDVEFPAALDGYINIFYFSIDGLENELLAFNIAIFRKKPSVKAKRILEVFDEITAVLFQNGIDEKYYKLKLD